MLQQKEGFEYKSVTGPATTEQQRDIFNQWRFSALLLPARFKEGWTGKAGFSPVLSFLPAKDSHASLPTITKEGPAALPSYVLGAE